VTGRRKENTTVIALSNTADERETLVTTVRVRELAQQEALERLLTLLDPETNSDLRRSMPMGRWDDPLHRWARLRAARAAYVLNTSGEVRRIGNGAWLLTRRP
jgi:hypothetical protein